MSDLCWSHPQRTRRSVNVHDRHLGYLTLVSYPNRDITAHSDGSPFRELVIADAKERHVALLQRFKEHWLVQCGEHYGTIETGGILNQSQALELALFTLQEPYIGDLLVEAVTKKVDAMLER